MVSHHLIAGVGQARDTRVLFDAGATNVRLRLDVPSPSNLGPTPSYRICPIDGPTATGPATCEPATLPSPDISLPNRAAGEGVAIERADSGSTDFFDLTVTFDSPRHAVTLVAADFGSWYCTDGGCADNDTTIEFSPYRAGNATANLNWQTGRCTALMLTSGAPPDFSRERAIASDDQYPPSDPHPLRVHGAISASETFVEVVISVPSPGMPQPTGCSPIHNLTLGVSYP